MTQLTEKIDARTVPKKAVDSYQQRIDALRKTVSSGQSRPLAWRREQLNNLAQFLKQERGAIEEALKTDLGKSWQESSMTEIGITLEEISYIKRHLRSLVRPKFKPLPLLLLPGTAKVRYEPFGVALIIAPWNYPVFLLASPMAAALAAGNAVVLKPSELSPHVSHVFAELMPKYFPADVIEVVEGGAEESSELLKHRFDYIFFTGGARVGQIVAEAAAKHLTPVTLELGGKSPTWVDETVNLKTAARRIAWGKGLNSGQTCVAPDYILTTPTVAKKLAPLLREAFSTFYGNDTAASEFYGRIVNTSHTARLRNIAELDSEQKSDLDSVSNSGERFLPPTIIENADSSSPSMQEEIFGPVLPIVEVSNADEAITWINAGEKPLALYVFSSNKEVRKKFELGTSSGALTFGLPVGHLLAPSLPFGGVGQSGYGSYGGKHGFKTFSHAKSVVTKPLFPDTLSLTYPPFGTIGNLVFRYLAKRGAKD